MSDVFDRIAGRVAGGGGAAARLATRPTPRFAEPAAAGNAPGPLDADRGQAGSGRGVRDAARDDVPPARAAWGEAAPPDAGASGRPSATAADEESPQPTRATTSMAPDAVPGAFAQPRRSPSAGASPPAVVPPATWSPATSSPATSTPATSTPRRGGRRPVGAARPQTEPRTGTRAAPHSETEPLAVSLPPARRTPPARPAPTRTLTTDELVREHIAPALVVQGAVSARLAESLTAVDVEPIEVPAGGDVHVHIGRVELRQPAAPPRPAESRRAADRADRADRAEHVDHADYLARQRRRWS